MTNNFYITTSIPYVNAEPHIGYGLEILYADILARYARQQGKVVMFSTGTDEHGSKIAEKAEELKITPKALSDTISQSFRDLTKTLNISNDRFIRTTDKAHEQRAQIIWKNLSKDIYKGKYSGWYCTGCEEFVTENTAKERHNICPIHGKPYQKIEEENYFFKLSSYSQTVQEAIQKDIIKIFPATRKNEILSVISGGLEDISISRPKDKIAWGIPVPGDTKQVMYVWFEALMNYITVLGYPEHADFRNFWPANVQIVGKDILRFHAGVWPGMLLALNLPLPKVLYVHGFITANGQKMSKSIGNVISPTDVVKRLGIDAFRYYFARHISSYEDSDFTYELFDRAYNDELGNELGNAVQRVASMIKKYQNGLIGDIPEPAHDSGEYHQVLAECRFDKALDVVWERVRGLNQFIDEEKPWIIAKDVKDSEHLRDILASCAGSLIEIADLLLPFMPETSAKISDLFKEGYIKGEIVSLFPRYEPTKLDAANAATIKPAPAKS